MGFYFCGDSDHVWHVSAGAADNSGGGHSFATARKTLVTADSGNGAITDAASGDMIVIWPGTYAEAVDLATLTKSLEIVGTNKYLSKIAPASGNAITLYDKTILRNMTVDSAGTALIGAARSDILLEDCYIDGDSAALNTSLVANGRLVARRCDFISKAANTISLTPSFASAEIAPVLFEECIVAGVTPASVHTILRNLLIGLNSLGRIAGVFRKSIFTATRTDVSGRFCYAASVVGRHVFDDCIFQALMTDGSASGPCAALETNDAVAASTRLVLNNCNIKSSGGGSNYDISNAGGSRIVIANSIYDKTQVNGDLIDMDYEDGKVRFAGAFGGRY